MKKTLLLVLYMISIEAIGQYAYYKTITINNSTGSALTNYQVLVIFDSQTEISASHLQSNCADIRFTTSLSSSSYLNHWIERGCNTTSTRVWVKVPSIPTGSTTIYLHHNNPSATDASNGDNTFIFFDDLSSGSLSASKWELKKASIQTTGGDSPTDQYSQNDNTVSSAFGQLRINSTNYSLPSENYALHFSFYDPGNISGSKNIWGGFANASSTSPSDFLVAGLPMLDNTVLHYWYYYKTSSTTISTNYLTGGPAVSTSTRTNSWNQMEMYRRANSYGTTDFITLRYGGNVSSSPTWFSSGVTPSYVTLYSTSYSGAFDNVFIRNYTYPDPTVTVGSSALPVELISFNAKANGSNQAELSWSTASELINDGFEIQKSTDGATFHKIGYVKGHGTTNEKNEYSFIDPYLAQRSYYKLKQWDWDGNTSYSMVRLVDIQSDVSPNLKVHPNPISTFGQLNFVGIGDEESIDVELFDNAGQPVKILRGSLDEVSEFFQSESSALPNGLYVARALTSSGYLYCKFIKF